MFLLGMNTIDASKRSHQESSPNDDQNNENNRPIKIQKIESQSTDEEIYTIECSGDAIFPGIPLSVIKQSQLFTQILEEGAIVNNTFSVAIEPEIMEIVLEYMRFLSENTSQEAIKIKLLQDQNIIRKNMDGFIKAIKYLEIKLLYKIVCPDFSVQHFHLLSTIQPPTLKAIAAKKILQQNTHLTSFFLLPEDIKTFIYEAYDFLTNEWLSGNECFDMCKKFGLLVHDAPNENQSQAWCNYIIKLITEARYLDLQATLDCLCRYVNVNLAQAANRTIVQEVKNILKYKSFVDAQQFYNNLPSQMSIFKLAVLWIGSLQYQQTLDDEFVFDIFENYLDFVVSTDGAQIANIEDNHPLFNHKYIRFTLALISPLVQEKVLFSQPHFDGHRSILNQGKIFNLAIHNCDMRCLPREIRLVFGLRVLMLNKVGLTSLPEDYIVLSNIRKLDIRRNCLIEIPEKLRTLQNNQELTITGFDFQLQQTNEQNNQLIENN